MDRRRAAITIALCLLVSMFEGVDLQAAGVAAPRLLPLFKISPQQAGLFFSASTLGLLASAPISGWLADRIGRKIMLLVSVSVFGLASVATAYAGEFQTLTAMRLLTGLGLGGALPSMISLAAESVSLRRRGLAVGLMYGGMPLGGSLAAAISLVAGPDWRVIFLLGGAAPLLLAPAIWLWLTDPYHAQDHDARRPSAAAALAGEGRLAPTLLLWIAFGLTLVILYLLVNWLPSLMVSRGLPKAAAAGVQIAFNLTGAIGSLIAGRIMDLPRRGLTVAATFLVTLIGLLLLANTPASVQAALVAGSITGIGVMANQAVLYAMAPRFYPPNIRGMGVGAAVSVGRVGSLVGPLLAGLWIGAGHGAGDVLMHLAPILVAGAAAAVVLAMILDRRAEA